MFPDLRQAFLVVELLPQCVFERAIYLLYHGVTGPDGIDFGKDSRCDFKGWVFRYGERRYALGSFIDSKLTCDPFASAHNVMTLDLACEDPCTISSMYGLGYTHTFNRSYSRYSIAKSVCDFLKLSSLP